MSQLPARADGHLIVAAIRILEHLEEHPPTEEEIAALLRWHEDKTRVITRELADLGALAAIRSPFEVRYKLQDPARVDELPASSNVSDDFAREIEAFDERATAEQERIEEMLGSAQPKPEDPSKAALEDEFGDFKGRKPKDPFGGD
ncbi:hypothetical protein DRQ53_05000 [bacterium]|nr:MAG: hypothetical protein DRQ32_07325 [bacterium]RKZ16903.1 MAG: hypothetical protein DRQ53_05000 [bacterium]